MTKAPTLTPFQLLPHLLPPIHIDAETFVNIRRQIAMMKSWLAARGK